MSQISTSFPTPIMIINRLCQR